MKYRNYIISALLLSFSSLTLAATEDSADKARLEAEYRQALKNVAAERQAAEASMEKAHEQLRAASASKADAKAQSAAEQAAMKAELSKMNEELNHARRQLSETSREIARVNREVARKISRNTSTRFIIASSDKPVIGVIIGAGTGVGVNVLGVSPDGPSERAGMKQGDVIIAIGGRVLASVDDTGDIKSGLKIAMEDIEANEPVIISVERGSETIDLIVTPEVREPLAWHSVSRFSSAPASPSAPDRVIRIEQIVVPEIDTVALKDQIDRVRADIDTRELIIQATQSLDDMQDMHFEYEFHDLSEIGDIALHEANVWFGMPLTSGLKLVQLDKGLGEYFKTDRGVLVVSAKNDHQLLLQSGDVILNVGDTEVNSPAEFMRALRDLEAGQELVLDIKRNRTNMLLKSTMPDSRTGFYAPQENSQFRFRVTKSHD